MTRLATLTILTILIAIPAAAQPIPPPRSPLVRADAHGMLGWFNADANVPESYNDWYNRSLYGGAGFGWYWTDHLKTEIEFGATSAVELYSGENTVVAGRPTFLTFRNRFKTTKLAAAQQYQFYRNAWFHPHLAAGVDFSWETTQRRDDPVFGFDPIARVSRITREGRDHSPTTSLEARPFAAVGFKAYMTQRSFFRSDLRFAVRSGVDEVLWRFGFGMDL